MDDIKAECIYGQVHVKEEEDDIKEELEWEGGAGLSGISAAAARAGLYAGHEVKDELVLGPERVQPPDIAFTLYAYQALAARAQPALRECVARPETHVAHNADVGNQVHSNDNIHTEKETYVWGACNKRFAVKTCLVENLMIHIYQEPEQGEMRVAHNARGGRGEGREPTRREGREPTRGEGREPTREDCRHACLICHKDFPTPSRLKTHERIHTGERPFSCRICQQKFTQSGNLKRHERTHTGQRPFSCGICQQKFTESGHLKRHERTHTGQRPFSCGICKQKFTLLSSLKSHERTHTGQRPFSCGICKQKFTRLSNLKSHERTHTGEKPFSCGICQLKFTRSGSLKRHEKTHTGEKPFACEMCKKQFTRLRSLKNHKDRIHADQKLFCCDICQKRFAQKPSLVGHIRLHMAAKPR